MISPNALSSNLPSILQSVPTGLTGLGLTTSGTGSPFQADATSPLLGGNSAAALSTASPLGVGGGLTSGLGGLGGATTLGTTGGLGGLGGPSTLGTTGGLGGLGGVSALGATGGLGGPSALGASGGSPQGSMGEIMGAILQMLTLILSMFAGGGLGNSASAGSGGAGGAGGAGASAAKGGNPALDFSGGPGLTTNGATPGGNTNGTNHKPTNLDNVNTTTDPTQKARLNGTLDKISKDPEGSKLLKAAMENGYTIEVGDPAKAAGADSSHGQVNGVTLPDQKKIIISPDAPEFDKTVAHELVHAATDSDGNSIQEEGVADVVAYRINGRITGNKNPMSEEEIAKAKEASYTVEQTGAQNNDIIQTLAKIGIQAFQ